MWPTWRELREDFKAWRRGERRVVPYGVRGRVYERISPPPSLGGLLATGRFKASIRPTGYYNAAEGRWYDVDEAGRRTPRKE